MARATPAWTNTETTDWLAGLGVRQTDLLEQLLQNLEYMAQNHNHTGGDPNGAAMPLADPKAIWFYSINGGPFA